jgi:hypothetical protein
MAPVTRDVRARKVAAFEVAGVVKYHFQSSVARVLKLGKVVARITRIAAERRCHRHVLPCVTSVARHVKLLIAPAAVSAFQ